MKPRSAICWCLIVSLPLAGWPQVAPLAESQGSQLLETERSAKVKSDVEKRGTGEQARVNVIRRDQTAVKGYISQIDSDSFQVTDRKSGKVTLIAYREVNKVRSQGMSTGAKIAIATGVGVAVIVILVALRSTLNHS